MNETSILLVRNAKIRKTSMNQKPYSNASERIINDSPKVFAAKKANLPKELLTEVDA